MKQVVIEMRNGQPVIVSCPKKIEVIIRKPKHRSLKKRLRTLWWNLRHKTA